MKLWLVMVFAVFFLGGHPVQATPLVVQGGADLSVVDWQRDGVVNLSGGWQFYWNQLLSPEELAAGQGKITVYLSPEQQWQLTSVPGWDVNHIGAATYHVRLYVPEAQELTLMLPLLNTASRVWINQELRQDFGRVTLTEEGAEGYVRENAITFHAPAGETGITIQVSNHLFWYGGGSLPVRIGPPSMARELQNRATMNEALSFGFIMFMSLYHIYIRFILKRSNGALYFGLFALAVGLRMAVVGEGQVFYAIWPMLSFKVRYFIEYMCLSSCVGLAMSFYRELYPQEAPRWAYRPPVYVSVIYCAAIILLPARYYPGALDVFQLVMLVTGVCTVATVIVAAYRGRDGARLLVVANCTIFLTLANDIAFSQRIIHTFPMIHYGMIFMLFCQAIILAQRFARSHQRAEDAEQAVKRMNLNLEEKIQERTEQINTILAHAQSGFLLIDRQGSVQTGYTKSCESILGLSLDIGSGFPQQLNFPARLRTQFLLAVDQIFAGDLPLEVAITQLPDRFPMGTRMISLQGAAVKQKDGTVSALLLTINDVTDLVAAEEGLRRADVLIHILEDQDAFRIFLADYKSDLATTHKAVLENDRITLLSTLHTMKGNAASFNLDDWVQLLHQLEERPVTIADVQNLTQKVRHFLRQNEGILHLDFENPLRSVFAVDQSDLNALTDSVRAMGPTAVLERIDQWARGVKALPLRSYTNPLNGMVARVSRQLQKNVILLVEGADVKVDAAYNRLLTTLPHVVRNSLVHGIEDPEDRHGKPEQAHITLRFASEKGGGLSIEISDDGRGLDAEHIRSHAIEQGLIAASATLNEEQTFALIFHPNFSTADRVNDLAGRGMGLAAVAAAVQELGGRCTVSSERNRGMRLSIHVPAPSLQAETGRALTAS